MGNGNGEMTGGNYYRRNECASTQRQRAVTTRRLTSSKRQATEMLAGRPSRAFPLSFQGLFSPFSTLFVFSDKQSLHALFSFVLPLLDFTFPIFIYLSWFGLCFRSLYFIIFTKNWLKSGIYIHAVNSF